MGRFTDEVEEVSAVSSSGAVRATMTRETKFFIELDEQRLDGHTDASLVEEIEEVTLKVWDDYQDMIAEIVGNESVSYSDPGMKRGEQETWAKLAKCESAARSPHGFVEATVYGIGDVIVRFHGRPVSRRDVTARALEKEINDAISAAGEGFASIVEDEFQAQSKQS